MAADPWIIAPMERQKHNEQFQSLGPVGGFVTGEQAKGFFLQSRLPPQILGVIWMLADMDGDGRMNQTEFSIACKLINMKLRGFNLPTALPHLLKQSAMSFVNNTAMAQSASMTSHVVSAAPHISTGNVPSQQAPISSVVSGGSYGVQNSSPPVEANTANSASYSVCTPPKPIQDPSANEWGVPQATKLKFTQVFNMCDRTKSGFISGIQARNILIQSALPQASLAQIWTLSDVDNDGRLSCEEFVLALYLCEQAKAGKPVPSTLPPDLIPPSLRRSRTSSIQSQGSIASADVSSTPQLISADSFEDKRKENYEKGQAELDRRRKALMDAQRRETEERMRREREEEMKREKARQEAERKRQEELEIEMMRQKEIENQKEMERKRMEEVKEDARKEAERQRQEEWEKQRLMELVNVRQRHQENLMALKAKNQSLTIELNSKEDRVKEITQSISETRTGVTDVKAAIDGMRNTRDKHMSDMNSLKAQAKEQNQRLLNLNQEKARLKARSLASAGASGAETAAVEASITSKQLVIKQLQEKLQELEDELRAKEHDVNNNLTEFQSAKDQFVLTGDRCTDLYEEYMEKHKKVLVLREKLLNPDTAWGDSGDTSWKESNKAVTADTSSKEGRTFRALYQFDARNEDELTLLPGDLIVELVTEGNEPGWLSGNLNGKIGWFPEAYCELADGEINEYSTTHSAPLTSQDSVSSVTKGALELAAPAVQDTAVLSKAFGQMVSIYSWSGFKNNHLTLSKGDRINVKGKLEGWLYGELNGYEGWFPESYVKDPNSSVLSPVQAPELPPLPDHINHDDISQFYLAVYPYSSEEPGDLVFEAGETMIVVKKEGDWWYGVIGDRNGIFPSNYVQVVPNQRTKKLAVAQVIAPYDATSPNQLSLVRGQLLSIRKKTSTGWWEGELHAKGKKREVGWFPASYVKILCGSSRTTPVSMRDDVSGGFTQGDLADAFSNKAISIDQKISFIPPQEPEVVEALYPYTAVNDDELTFKAGDQIFVIDKEDSAWWKGSLKGVIGVFPSNYVKIKSEAKVIEKPINITSPDAEDSLCYNWEADLSTNNGALDCNSNSPYDYSNSPAEAKRQNVIAEIITTEYSYYDDLVLVQTAFIEPLLKSSSLTSKEIDLIFINWEELVLVSSAFKKSLRVRRMNAPDGNIHMISDILCQQVKQLKPYMRFCSLQAKGSDFFNRKLQEDTVFANVIKKCQSDPKISGLTLTSFLLKPMQRLLKYPLLIKKLLSCTPPSHPDYLNTVEALDSSKTLCEQVNEAAREVDNTDKLEWMQNHINCDSLNERVIFNSLTNTLGPRKLILMGVLHKTKSKREIVAFLLNDFLLLTTPSKHIGASTSLQQFQRLLADITCTMYRKPLFLSEMTVKADQDSELAFQVSSSGIEVSLSTNSSNERNNWLKAIKIAQKHIADTEKSQLHRTLCSQKSTIYGRVLLSVMSGSNLMNSKNGTLHSFCEVSLGSQVEKTKICTSPNPKWDASMQFLVKSLSEDVLCFTVYEKGFFKPNEFLGCREIRIQDILDSCSQKPDPQVRKYPLQEVSQGEITIKYSMQLFK